MSSEEMRRARTRANPFETIKKGIFQNRAAMKMANMDHVFGYMFTDPRDEFGVSVEELEDFLNLDLSLIRCSFYRIVL